MKIFTQPIGRAALLFLVAFSFNTPVCIATPPTDSLLLERISVELRHDLRREHQSFDQRDLELRAALWNVETRLQALDALPAAERVSLLERKLTLWDDLRANEFAYETNTLKIRYRKGIDLIKILYEKILALDHHFTGMQTYQNVMMLSNPHTYPDFARAQGVLEQKMKRKNPVTLPGILQTNPFMTAAFSVMGTLLSDGSSQEKQQDLEDISCILDFTVRMNSDLSIIQHETEFLRTANKNLREECEKLFEDYTKVIDYYVPLENCRQNDDWETLYEHLDRFVNQLNGSSPATGSNYRSNASGYGNTSNNSGGYGSGSNNSGGYGSGGGYGGNSGGYGSGSGNSGGYGSGSGYGGNSGGYGNNSNNSGGYGSGGYGSGNTNGGYGSGSGYGNNYSNSNSTNSGYGTSSQSTGGGFSNRQLDRKRVDLEFSTQRVADFITRYNDFITQGTHYYQKFDNIIASYANEEVCSSKLPRQFNELKYDIKSTIEKFTNTYNLPEIQGSRLKDLLHGTYER